jgi:hypothetical protein
LEGQDGSDPGQIEAVVEESADLSEADEIVIAIATGASLAAGWIDQTPGLVEPKVLRGAAYQFGRYGNAVQAPVRIGTLSVPRRLVRGKNVKTTCIGHGLQDITNL